VARSRRHCGLALGLAGAVLAVDQLSKWAVLRKAADLPYRVVGGLRLELTYNSGISFSRLNHAGALVVALVALVAAGVSAALYFSPPRYRPAIGVILGGALGNLVDRLRLGGAVVDFIGAFGWPPFNMADAAIVAGTAILVLQVLRGSRS
jgi:signal peptidase II